MNTAETDLATKILNAAADTASRQNAGDTLLFVQAYSTLIEASSASVRSYALWQKDENKSECDVKDCALCAGATAINVAEPTLPDLGEPTPIRPIPAPTGRTRRTKAQIEADNAAAAQATAPAAAEPEPAAPEPTPAAAPVEAPAPPEGIDGITLSTLFKTILSSKEEPDKTTFKNAVRAKLEAVGIPQISKLTPEHFESFNTFLLSFKA